MYSKSAPARQSKKCPVCNYPVNDSMLFVDLYTLKILKDAPKGVDEVTVNVEDKCSWVPLIKTVNMQEKRPMSSNSPVLISEEAETIDLTEDTTVYAESWVDKIPMKPEPPMPKLSQSLQTASPRLPNLLPSQFNTVSVFNGIAVRPAPNTPSTNLDLVMLPEIAQDAPDVYMLDLTISNGPPVARTVPAKRGTSFADAIEL